MEKINMVKAAQLAMDVQDACNLSGVVHSFSSILTLLWEIGRETGKGTDWVNKHPICVLFASKIQSLTGEDFSTAWTECKKITKENS